MKDKKQIVMISLLMAIILLGIGTIAYFRRTVNGSLTGQAGNLVLIVNEANAVANETFNVSLNRSTEEPYVMPGDSGTFNINIDSTGSSTDVDVTITMTRSNLPNNLKFYLDSSYTKELTTQKYTIKKADTMTKTVPVYWYWDGSKDDTNDTLFMGQSLEAVVNVSAVVASPVTLKTLMLENAGGSATLDTNVNFLNAPSATNGEGLMMMSSTQNDANPIYYYRGDVSNNNVVFADSCWLIVRTTATGGIKLLYNGEVNNDGSCNNYSGVGGESANSSYTDTFLGGSGIFRDTDDPVVGFGYMYSPNVEPEYEGWFLDQIEADMYVFDSYTYETHLKDMSRLDGGTGRYVQNENDSDLKEQIDEWYVSNILNTSYKSLLEDEVWCNDRGVDEDYSDMEGAGYMKFISQTRVEDGEPSLACGRDVDSFTINRDNGNGDLIYPIALLTADEILLSGINSEKNYLKLNSGNFWTMTPAGFSHGADGWSVGVTILDMYCYNSSSKNLSYDHYNNYSPEGCYDAGVRPAISLSSSASVTDGNGSFETPYIIG